MCTSTDRHFLSPPLSNNTSLYFQQVSSSPSLQTTVLFASMPTSFNHEVNPTSPTLAKPNNVTCETDSIHEDAVVDTPDDPVLSHTVCWAILDEAISLVRCSPHSAIQHHRLYYLMYNFFQNGSTKSDIFRSLICHDDANIFVTVDDFNTYVVQPYSNFELKLGGPLHSDLPIHL